MAGSETGYTFLAISVRPVIESALKIYCLLVEIDEIVSHLILAWVLGIRIFTANGSEMCN